MIQRIQTLWLALAAICSLLTLFLFFYVVYISLDSPAGYGIPTVLNASTFGAIVIPVAAALVFLVSVVTIFLFKNRKGQLLLTNINSLLLLLMIVFTVINMKLGISFYVVMGGIALTALFNILAQRGIKKDEELIRSLNSGRLR